jgi:chromate transporter
MLKNLYLLFIKFFKIGAFTFGGGYAMISLIHNEVVDKMKWLSDDEMMRLSVIAESTPGVLAINTATFTGYKIAGFWGSAAATLGVTVPSVIVICVISLFFDAFKSLKYVAYAFNGIRAGVILLIIDAARKLNKKNKKDMFYFVIVALTIAAKLFTGIDVIYILIAAAVLGIAYSFIFPKKETITKEPEESKDGKGGENK